VSGDYTLESSVFILFTTRAFATGIPDVLSAATVAVYENVTATPIETGIAVTETLNGINGLNAVTIAALAASGYQVGGHYHGVLEAGNVDSVSVIGEVVGHFSIGAGAAAEDLANGTDGLGAIKTDTAAVLIDTTGLDGDAMRGTDSVDTATMRGTDGANTVTPPTVAQLNARTLLAADYFDPAADAVANVTLVATTTTNSDVRGTDGVDTSAMRGTDGVDTAAMRGTDGANTVTPPTVAELNARTLVSASYALEATVAALNDLSAAQVNAEMLDVLTVDAFAEPGQITPLATTTLATKIAFLYKAFRNLMTNDGMTIKLFNDDGVTVDQKTAVSAAAGTVTRSEFTAGP